MRQQVNFYQSQFREKRDWFSLRNMALACALFFLVLLGVWAFALRDEAALRQALKEAQARQEATMKEIEALSQQYPLRQKNALLGQEIIRLSARLETLRPLLATLESEDFGNSRGFSHHLDALARRQVEGLWLTRIELAEGGSRFTLEGRMLSPELTGRYLDELAQEAVFSGVDFSRLDIRQLRPDEPLLQFELTTRLEEEAQ